MKQKFIYYTLQLTQLRSLTKHYRLFVQLLYQSSHSVVPLVSQIKSWSDFS